jgi:voltage-gated potassium channel
MVRLARNAEAYERFSQVVETPMMVLAVLWLPVLIVPYVVNLDPTVAESFRVVDYIVWALFVFEYLTKLVLTPTRGRFVRTHIADLIVIAVPMFRPLRILRVLRIGALATAVTKRGRAVFTHHGLHYVLLCAVLIVFAGSAIELGFEHHAHGSNIHNYGQALWWAIVTVTTVGYGDHFPVSPGGALLHWARSHDGTP